MTSSCIAILNANAITFDIAINTLVFLAYKTKTFYLTRHIVGDGDKQPFGAACDSDSGVCGCCGACST